MIGDTGRCGSGKGELGAATWSRQPPSSASASSSAAGVRTAGALVDIFHFDLLAADALRQRRGHEAVEIAVEHVGGRGGGDAGAQILDQLVGLQDVGADLVAPADVGLRGMLGAGLGLATLQFGLVEA